MKVMPSCAAHLSCATSLAAMKPRRVRIGHGLRSALGALLTMAAAGATDFPRVEPSAVDAIFATWDKRDSPGCALAVIHDRQIIYEHGYGWADLEHDVPITPATVFYIGSDSKQFTAACIVLLAQRGKLSLDDEVRKYVPSLPGFGAAITIRHLIHHTSGLPDYLAVRGAAGLPPDGVFGDKDVLALLAGLRRLEFEPGAKYSYSNSGYFLLSQIVRRVSGQSLREFAAANIFLPLGMGTAQFRDDHSAVVPNRAHAYVLRAGAYHHSEPNFDVVGAGGLFMNVRDFLPWDGNFYEPKVGGPEFIAQLQTRGQLADGTALPYACGLIHGTYRGLRFVEHGGAYGGFRAHVIRFPDQHFSIACFCNLAAMEPGILARKVAELYLNGWMLPR